MRKYFNYQYVITLVRTEEYVAFDQVNSKAYSIEYLTLLQTICSEIDAVSKTILSHFDSDFKTRDIGILKWGYEIQKHFPNITSKDVMFVRAYKIIPWKNWTIEERLDKNNKIYLAYAEGCGSPDWWKAYTAVKHARTAVDDGRVNYHRANQKNVIDALAALYVLHRMMIHTLDENEYLIMDKSTLYRMIGWNDELKTQFGVDDKGRAYIVCEDRDGEKDEKT